jgi:H+/Cl- antiporter ClcA
VTESSDILALVRTRGYVALLVLAALLGIPIAAAAYGFLALVGLMQNWLYTGLPKALGFSGQPLWWPLPLLTVAGLLVGVVIRYLPGKGGEAPHVGGFKAGGALAPIELPSVALAALATLGLGVVLGPEAPLIALGGGLALCSLRLSRRDLPSQASAVVAAAGSFAAISTLLGSPILGAFLLMEASGLGGPMLPVVLLPGLVASGIGALIFVGMDAWTGLGTFSLAIPNLPPFPHPDTAEFGWALIIGLAAVPIGVGIQLLARHLRPQVERHVLLTTPMVGLAIAGLAVGYAAATGKNASDVLFSGQAGMGPLIANSASYSVLALLLLLAFKGLAYGASLSSFRGGPIFPAMFLGAAGGIALSHLPGLPLVPGVAMGIGAMTVVMLRLPLTSVLLATLLTLPDGPAAMPLVIVAVAVAYVASVWLFPPEPPEGGPTSEPPRRDSEEEHTERHQATNSANSGT